MNLDKHRYFSNAKAVRSPLLGWIGNRSATLLSGASHRAKRGAAVAVCHPKPNASPDHLCASVVNFFANSYQPITIN
jgi:hypothetical protein